MSEIVNLRRVRKQVAREKAEAGAAVNRAKFGRTKAQKAVEDAERTLSVARLEGHALTKREDQ